MPSKRISIKVISAMISLIFLFASITSSFASSALRPNLMGGGGRLSASVKVNDALQTKELAYSEIVKWITNIFDSHRLNIELKRVIKLRLKDIITRQLKNREGVLMVYKRFEEEEGRRMVIKTHTVNIDFIRREMLIIMETTSYKEYTESMGPTSSKLYVEYIPEEIAVLAGLLGLRIERPSEYPFESWRRRISSSI